MIRTLRSVARFRRFEPNRAKRRLSRAASVADLRELARRRLPAGVFDYIDGAAEDELSMVRNAAAFDQWEFAPRVLRDVSALDTSVELLGRRHPVPFALAPTGFTRIVCPDGELAVARAAARKGIAYSLSTLSTRSIEEIREVSDGPLWFQLYFLARPGVGGRVAPAGGRLRLRGTAGGGGHAGVRPSGSETCAGGSPCRPRWGPTRCWTVCAGRDGRGRCCGLIQSPSPT